MTEQDTAAETRALRWPFRHLYLHLPAPLADDPAGWAQALRAEQRIRGLQSPQPALMSLLITGEGAPALGSGLVPFVSRVLGWEGSGAGAPVAAWTVELDLGAHPETDLDLWWGTGVHRVALRPLPLGARPQLMRWRPPAGRHFSTTLDLATGTPAALASEARDHLDAGAAAIALWEPEDAEISDEARIAVRSTLLDAGWVEADLAFFHAPGVDLPGPRAIRSREPVLGLGPGAVTFRHPWRCWNPSSPASYLEAVGAGRDPRAGEEMLDAAASRIERIWHALRTPRGLRCPGYEAGEPMGLMGQSLAAWARLGYLAPSPGRVILTPHGQRHVDAITVTLAERLES